MEQVTIRLIESMEDPLFWPALEFYVESFPRSEREPLERVAEVASGQYAEMGRETGHYHHLAVAVVGDRLAGFRYFSSDAPSGLGFFIYLAVDPAFRERGIGKMLIDFGIAQCRADLAAHGAELQVVFFECERPWLAEGEARLVRERRLEFFANRGAVRVSDAHVQPALADDREEVPLVLLAYPLVENVDWKKAVADLYRSFLGYEPESEAERNAIAGIKL